MMTKRFTGQARPPAGISLHHCKCVLQAGHLHFSPSVVRRLGCLFHHSLSDPIQQRPVKSNSRPNHTGPCSILPPSSPLLFPPNFGVSPMPKTLPTPPLASSPPSPPSTR